MRSSFQHLLRPSAADRGQRIHFLETLHALAGRVVGEALPADEELTIHDKMVQRLPKVRDPIAPNSMKNLTTIILSLFLRPFALSLHQDEITPKYTAADYYAAIYVKTSIRGFLVRAKVSSDDTLSHRNAFYFA
jgi:hypothetical protein